MEKPSTFDGSPNKNHASLVHHVASAQWSPPDAGSVTDFPTQQHQALWWPQY